jgi:hypothetical protein
LRILPRAARSFLSLRLHAPAGGSARAADDGAAKPETVNKRHRAEGALHGPSHCGPPMIGLRKWNMEKRSDCDIIKRTLEDILR